MPIPDARFSGCCDWGFDLIGRRLEVFFTSGDDGANNAIAQYSQDGAFQKLENVSANELMVVCDDRERKYTYQTYDTGSSGLQLFPTIQRRALDYTIDWSYDDSGIDISGDGPLPGFVNNHFDLDASYNLYYCGEDAAEQKASVRKLDSSGTSVWLTEIYTAFSSGTTRYRFLSCAVDLDGNVCAVGGRIKSVSGSPVKSDYVIYYFDSDGAEVWHDDITDGTTENSTNFSLWGSQVAFDSSGNVYVGFSHNKGSSATLPWIRKYDDTGSVQWTKTKTASSVVMSNLMIVKDDKLVSLTDGKLQQFSGASHGTEDWNTTISGLGVQDFTANSGGDLFVSNSTGFDSTRWNKYSGVDGSLQTSGGEISDVRRIVAMPGRYPHFT